MKKIIAWNTISQIVGKFFQATTAFLISILIAKSFGVEGYGDFTKITTFVTFFYLLSDFGFNAVFLKQQKASSNAISWNTLLSLRILWSFVLTLLCLAVVFILPSGAHQGYTYMVRLGILLYSPSIMLQAILISANAIFQKYLRYDFAAIALSVGSLVSLVIIFFVSQQLFAGYGPILATHALLLASFISVLVSLYYVWKTHGRLKLTFPNSTMLILFRLSIPLGITLLFNQVFFRADSFIMTITRSTAEVGVYGFAYRIFEMFLVLPTFFMNAMYPLFLQKMENKKVINSQNLLSPFWFAFRLLFILSILAILFTYIFSPLLRFVGTSFLESAKPLKILSLGFPFFFLSSLTMWTLLALNKERLLLTIYAGAAVFALIGYVVFIPYFGYYGAAWITVLTELFVLLLSAYFLRVAFRKNV